MYKLINTIKIGEDWADKNKMKINKQKSKIMIIGNNMKYTEWEKSINK